MSKNEAKASEWLASAATLSDADRALFKGIFESQGIHTVADVKMLSRDDLVELKVAIGPRNRFLTAVTESGSANKPEGVNGKPAGGQSGAAGGDAKVAIAMPGASASANERVRCDKNHAMTQFTGKLPVHYAIDAIVTCDVCRVEVHNAISFYHCLSCKTYDMCNGCAVKSNGRPLVPVPKAAPMPVLPMARSQIADVQPMLAK